MAIFDFHLHPSMKTMFSTEEDKVSPWEDITKSVVPALLEFCANFSDIICSQANLTQLIYNQGNIVVIALIAPERAMTTSKLLLNGSGNKKLKRLLSRAQLDLINAETASPFQLVLDNLDKVLLNPARFGMPGKGVVPLQKKSDYKPDGKAQIFAAFSVEGPHSLADTYHKDDTTAAEAIKNLDILRSKVPVFSVNLAHIERFPFANHAYGMLFIPDEEFIPKANGISSKGLEFVKLCYERKVMIDIKHLSLGARQQLINDVRKVAEDFTDVPIVCTHTGFAGISTSDIPDYMIYNGETEDKGYGKITWGKPKLYGFGESYTTFNPSSINLYDNEIMAVLISGGMIGLSLDLRILGVKEYASAADPEPGNFAEESEYISVQEKKLFTKGKTKTGSKMQSDKCITDAERKNAQDSNNKEDYHFYHFMSHVLHYIYVVTANEYDWELAKTQLCIGSDLDGVIDPIACCTDVRYLEDMKGRFKELFRPFAQDNNRALPAGFNVADFAERLFYRNGRDFVLGRLSKIAGT